jgi:hypothetical protein
MNALQKERMFRREIAWKIAEIEDKQCAPCDFSGRSDTIAHHCRECSVYLKLNNLGNLLTENTNKLRDKKYDRPKVVEITKELYLEHKENGLLDKDICEKYGISLWVLRSRKQKWGINKPRKSRRKFNHENQSS